MRTGEVGWTLHTQNMGKAAGQNFGYKKPKCKPFSWVSLRPLPSRDFFPLSFLKSHIDPFPLWINSLQFHPSGYKIKSKLFCIANQALYKYCPWHTLTNGRLRQPCVHQVSQCHFFQQHLLTSYLCHCVAILAAFQTFFIIILFIIVICDRWFQLLRAQMMVSTLQQ